MTSQNPDKQDAHPVSAKQVYFATVVSVAAASLGIIHGWTAVLPKMQEDPNLFPLSAGDVAWLVSLASAVGVFGALFTGPVVEYVGPRRLITVCLCLIVGFWMLMAFPPHKVVLFVGRTGISVLMVLMSTSLQPLIAELSPTSIRGLISTLPEIAGAFGMFLGYLLAYLAPWSLATALCSLPAAILVVPLVFVPESPYWLVRRGRIEDARASLQRLLGSKTAVEQQLTAISSSSSAFQMSRRKQFTELRKSQNFCPVLLVLSMFVLRELGGRSCLNTFSVYIFRDAGVQLDAFTCTVLLGVVRLLSTCVAAAILDRVGRRPLLITTAVVGGLSQGVGGLFLYLQVPWASWVPFIALLLYQASYGAGIGSIPWVLVGELLPSPVRSVGASIVGTCNSISVFSISLSFLKITAAIGVGPVFIIFGVITSLIGGITWLWLPETRGVTLEELEVAFAPRRKEPQVPGEQPVENEKLVAPETPAHQNLC